MPPHAQPAVVALAGPTASGKSAAALALAQRLDAEIVSVDSALVYRGMDIGTAKPTAEERARVPHHLVDIRDPAETYSAAEFAADAQQLVRAIRARGRAVVLAGGTMLYFKALFEGLAEMPPADPELRAEIEAQAVTAGWPALHAQLAQVDALTAARLAPNDAQRIQRALEVFRLTGMPLSRFHEGTPRGEGLRPDRFLSLEPADRAWLHERIAQRFDAMLAAGFLDEVRRLRARGDLHAQMPSMRAVGYRQAWEALDGLVPLEGVRERGIAATRQLAKRQLTWLRGMPQRQVIACDAPDALQQVLRACGVDA
ncbi:tRNA (adenosine(37)-N6)-dimethylallyltransferase MiaA [Ramlibacter sp. USB13]|uniref:tRNA dimethylallyltransferase n=1 Tax=Ramlibacter cellulosilyticus TaxID=2764187 RepID=A0A923MNK2_9BURK|nr:tRNA (adenosine(37)-N6)-dimethylallyltransferase MiaA [Ramlibacter cellulosilyticus]MBC5782378.1 tRNA (adenosine(37)-N6)-dimethylallyltransferase MiaA [Ramlibacter cellulosilyticus]